MRGNQQTTTNPATYSGSIPACAGEPGSNVAERALDTVYPRVCGGTTVFRRRPESVRGLSPRVRGNRPRQRRSRYSRRSIPACAGEPLTHYATSHKLTVYPRVCGGTNSMASSPTTKTGLSPRVRGNLWSPSWQEWQLRSIPACAGEPCAGIDGCTRGKVYPRVCGGTWFS